MSCVVRVAGCLLAVKCLQLLKSLLQYNNSVEFVNLEVFM